MEQSSLPEGSGPATSPLQAGALGHHRHHDDGLRALQASPWLWTAARFTGHHPGGVRGRRHRPPGASEGSR
eukprot:10397743-Heterocapsa_arctica.AAC.1